MEVEEMQESKEILMAIATLQADVKNIANKMDGLAKTNEKVIEIDQSIKSAHNRIDDLKDSFNTRMKEQKEDYEKKLIDQKLDYEKKLLDQEEDLKEDVQNQDKKFTELKGHIVWLWRTVAGGAIGLGFGVALWAITNYDKLLTLGG